MVVCSPLTHVEGMGIDLGAPHGEALGIRSGRLERFWSAFGTRTLGRAPGRGIRVPARPQMLGQKDVVS